MQKKIISKQIRKYGTYEEKIRERRKKKEKILNIHNLIDNKKFALALSSIENYINSYSEDCYVIYEYGRYFFRTCDYKKSKEYFLINVENNSENKYYSMYELGKIEKNEYNYEAALNYFDEIIESKHNQKCYALLEKAKIYRELEKYEEEEKILLNIINNKLENYKYAVEEMVELNIEMKNPDKALLYLKKLKTLNSNRYKILEGKILLQKNKIKEAKKILEEINQNNINYKKAQYELAEIEYLLSNYEESLNILNNLENYNSNLTIRQIFLYINNYLELGKKEKTLEYIETLSEFGNLYRDNCYYYLGKVELLNGNYNKAFDYFEKVTTNKIKTYKSTKLQEIFILIKKEKYEEAYIIFNELKKIGFDDELRNFMHTMLVYFNKKLNLNLDITSNSYIDKLIVNYDKKLVLKHISKHKYSDYNKLKHTLFNYDIDVEEIYDFAYNNINEANYIDNNFTDCYILKYNNIGINSEGICNYLKVVTLPNSKEIVTIYPYDDICIDDFMYEEVQEEIMISKQQKVKKISQIDKFNKKYGIS